MCRFVETSCSLELLLVQPRSTAVSVGRARQVLIASLHEINFPPMRSFNKLSNGVSHMQMFADVSEIQHLDHSAIARRCTEIVVRSINAATWRIFSRFLYKNEGEEVKLGAHFWYCRKVHNFLIPVNLFQYLEQFSHKSTEYC